MTDMKLINQGAEARIYTCTYLSKMCVVKERFEKQYRHPQLDHLLTKERIRSETKAISRCREIGIKTPTLYLVDFERKRIYMEYFENGVTLKDYIIDKLSHLENGTLLETIAKNLGGILRKMHENKIVHGDLTTSNIIILNSADIDPDNIEIVMIDFGLAHLNASNEDKGVDLYVLERAILSTHNDLPNLFPMVLDGYNSFKEGKIQGEPKEVIKKFEEVRARGRKRTMIG